MGGEKYCPECLSMIAEKAVVCKYCGSRIVGIKCRNCASMCKPEARSCKWCGTILAKKSGVKLTRSVEIEATFLGTLFSRKSLFPQRIVFKKDKIIISTFGFLGLTRKNIVISWEKIAGLKHKKGLLWDTISIETYEHNTMILLGIRHSDAIFIKKIVQ